MSYTTFYNHKRRKHADWFNSSLAHKESVQLDHVLEGNADTVQVKEGGNLWAQKQWSDTNNDSDCEPGANDAVPKIKHPKVECTLCSQEYTEHGLVRHMKWQHSTNINEFICDICGAR